jgi:hypothetical protein
VLTASFHFNSLHLAQKDNLSSVIEIVGQHAKEHLALECSSLGDDRQTIGL